MNDPVPAGSERPMTPSRGGRIAGLGRVAAWLATAVVVIAAVVAFGLILGASELAKGIAAATPAPTVTAPPPTPWLRSIAPGQLAMPPDSDCAACHVTIDGHVGVRPIPALAHPLHGWTTCTECHSNERLVQTAPGHTGIHADQCLVCHVEALGAAPIPQHPSLAGSDCLGCHGKIAPLPSSMVDKPSELCWLCHQARP
jgi:hypothetical protein